MNPEYSVRPDLAQAILHEAIKARTPAVLTYQSPAGWMMLKSRLVGIEADSAWILLELPKTPEPETHPPVVGQSLGVSFRRGHRKCVFNSRLAGESEAGADGRRASVLRLVWPEELQELQRRLYHRTPVPRGRLVPVDLWMTQAPSDLPADSMPKRGKMLDLSAGGISVEMPRDERYCWNSGRGRTRRTNR